MSGGRGGGSDGAAGGGSDGASGSASDRASGGVWREGPSDEGCAFDDVDVGNSVDAGSENTTVLGSSKKAGGASEGDVLDVSALLSEEVLPSEKREEIRRACLLAIMKAVVRMNGE